MSTSRVIDFFLLNDLPNPWKLADIPADLPFDSHGWFSHENMTDIMQWASQRGEIHTVIELGSWLGKSTRFFADLADLVIAIDHWEGSPEHHLPDRHDVRERLQNLFPSFLRNCRGYEDVIAPVRATTVDAAQLEFPPADIIYVDADHSFEGVLADLRNFFPKRAPGGLFCGDDWKWTDPQDRLPVREAVTKFAADERLILTAHGNFWRLELPEDRKHGD